MKILGVLACCGVVAVLASAGTAIDDAYGKGTSRAAVGIGVGNLGGWMGEASNAVPTFVEEIKPGMTRLANQGSDVLGATGTPPARTDLVDPADQTGGTP